MKLVSVLMPVYNCGNYVREAIESILNQTYSKFELIIIDDNSSDNTANIVKSFSDKRIQYYHNNKNLGITETLNRGLTYCKGSLIARMDGDDISHAQRFERQVDFLSTNPQVGLISCRYLVKDTIKGKTSIVCRNTTDAQIKFHMLFANQFVHPGVMMRADLMKKLKYHDVPACEDYDLWSRAIHHCQVANCTETLLIYRWHGANISLVKQKSMKKSVLYIVSNILNSYGIEHSEHELLLQGMIAVGVNASQLSVLGKYGEMKKWLDRLSNSKSLIERFGDEFIKREISQYREMYDFN